MYSVEYILKSDPYNCWNQYALTRWKWSARLTLFELWTNLGSLRSQYRRRIREV